VFRIGWIAQFLSKAVVTGSLAGAAVDVVIGELPKLIALQVALLIPILAGFSGSSTRSAGPIPAGSGEAMALG
jgi:MFS superfamily sulfate permease-like transporter